MTVRIATADDLTALTAICLRAKAHWGYDADFMAACADELTLQPDDLGPGLVCWDDGGGPLAVAQLSVEGRRAHLGNLFVDPGAMGRGIGGRLFRWAAHTARAAGADELVLDSDPYAEPFYLHMGARRIGEAPSGSIPGRMLPHMSLSLA
jgi:GNAT superfamily N-acetyltransferase